jgi:hypothetical protein
VSRKTRYTASSAPSPARFASRTSVMGMDKPVSSDTPFPSSGKSGKKLVQKGSR